MSATTPICFGGGEQIGPLIEHPDALDFSAGDEEELLVRSAVSFLKLSYRKKELTAYRLGAVGLGAFSPDAVKVSNKSFVAECTEDTISLPPPRTVSQNYL